jgi:hypothetical protein
VLDRPEGTDRPVEQVRHPRDRLDLLHQSLLSRHLFMDAPGVKQRLDLERNCHTDQTGKGAQCRSDVSLEVEECPEYRGQRDTDDDSEELRLTIFVFHCHHHVEPPE